MGAHLLLRLLIEELLAVKTGEPIIAELVDHGCIFPQIDEAGHAVQDDLGAVGLGYEVRGAVLQRGELIGLAVILGGDDDGDQGQLGVLLHQLQKRIAIHHRHHHIQQDQGNIVLAIPQKVQGCLAAIRLCHVVLAGQDHAQHLAVDLVVLHHKDPFLQ